MFINHSHDQSFEPVFNHSPEPLRIIHYWSAQEPLSITATDFCLAKECLQIGMLWRAPTTWLHFFPFFFIFWGVLPRSTHSAVVLVALRLKVIEPNDIGLTYYDCSALSLFVPQYGSHCIDYWQYCEKLQYAGAILIQNYIKDINILCLPQLWKVCPSSLNNVNQGTPKPWFTNEGLCIFWRLYIQTITSPFPTKSRCLDGRETDMQTLVRKTTLGCNCLRNSAAS